MINKFSFLILAIIFLSPTIGFSQNKHKNDLGLRFGWSFFLEDNDFETFEVYFLRDLPWIFYKNGSLYVNMNVNVSGGVLKQDNDKDYFSTVSSNLVVNAFNEKLSADIGGGFALLSDDFVGDHKFGGPFQFNYNFGVKLHRIFRNFGIGYRWYHLSDAGIFNGRGLNRNIIEVFYEF